MSSTVKRLVNSRITLRIGIGLILSGGLWIMTSCGPSASATHREPSINPMPELWESIVGDITELEKSHAPKKEWDRKAESGRTVRDTNELSAVLSQSGLSPSDRSEVILRFKNVEEVVHYGFESNFHALVFFKNDAPLLVKKW